jgi:hypothetical protein
LFLKLACFFTGLAGRFHNFELTQIREKKNPRNGVKYEKDRDFLNNTWTELTCLNLFMPAPSSLVKSGDP